MADSEMGAPPPPEGEQAKGPEEGDEVEKQFFAGEERTLRQLRDEAEREAGREGGGDTLGKDEPEVEGEEELRRLMSPKKSARHPILAILVISASLYGMWWLRDDLTYFLRSRTPTSLGQATKAVKEGSLQHNTYVTLKGMRLSQSVASYKLPSVFSSSKNRRAQWLILAGTNNKVLVSQTVYAADSGEQGAPKGTDEIRGTYTGRLRLLGRTDFDKRVRADYLRMSKASPMLRPFHRVAGAEILARAGTAGEELKDLAGETFRVHGDTLLEIFVTFPDEYELDIHTDLKDEIKPDIVQGKKIPPLAVTGGDGAPTCGPPGPWPPVPAGTAPTAPGLAPAPAPGAVPGSPAPRVPMGAPPAGSSGMGAPPAGSSGVGAPPAGSSGVGAPPAGSSGMVAPPAGAAPSPLTGGQAKPSTAPIGTVAEGAKPASPASRRSGWGGSLYLRFDPKVFLLDHLPAERSLVAPSGRPGDPPESASDQVIAVPEGTLVFNAKPRDCKLACRWEGPACLKGCSKEPHVELKPVGKQVLLAAGGDCGGGKGERHEVSLSVLPFPDAKRAEAFVESLGHPFLLTEDNSRTSRMVRFIVKLPDSVARDLIRRQKRSSPYNIAPRFEVFRVPWKHLVRRGGDLVITRTLRGYPEEHEVEVKDGKRRLRPVPVGTTLRIASSRVVKADITQLLRLPADVYVLEVGVRPGDMWTQPFVPGVPVFYLLFALFIVLNIMAIRSHFRK